MNYLFRPTPVVVLGRDMGADVVALSQSPAGMMAGTPRASSRPSRSLATQGSPWLVRSGTMASFGTLGQDPGFIDPGIIDPGFVDPGIGIDWSSAGSIAPNLPAPIPPDFPVAPDIGNWAIDISGGILPVTVTAPIAPSSGAGPTGQSIPGTQPINVVQAGTGILATIANFLKPSGGAPARSLTLPGVGVNPKQPAPSFWSTSTILPGTPNATVILGGAAALLLVFALMGSGGRK